MIGKTGFLMTCLIYFSVLAGSTAGRRQTLLSVSHTNITRCHLCSSLIPITSCQQRRIWSWLMILKKLYWYHWGQWDQRLWPPRSQTTLMRERWTQIWSVSNLKWHRLLFVFMGHFWGIFCMLRYVLKPENFFYLWKTRIMSKPFLKQYFLPGCSGIQPHPWARTLWHESRSCWSHRGKASDKISTCYHQ